MKITNLKLHGINIKTIKLKDYLNYMMNDRLTQYHLKKLNPEARRKAKLIIAKCHEKKFDIYIFAALIRLEDHAGVYRQSRPWKEIKKKMIEFRNLGFHYLADVIEEAEPCEGEFKTTSAPGELWHNYGEAFNAYPIFNNKMLCDYKDGENIWKEYGSIVKQAGMYWAGDWKGNLTDHTQAQLRENSNPLKVLTPEQVYDILRKRQIFMKKGNY